MFFMPDCYITACSYLLNFYLHVRYAVNNLLATWGQHKQAANTKTKYYMVNLLAKCCIFLHPLEMERPTVSFNLELCLCPPDE